MSSAKSKAISEIDLEEFERRLRVVRAPQAGVEDPLSELTRLVNTIAAERPRTEKVVDIASARMPKSEPFPNAHQLQRGTQAPSSTRRRGAPASARCAACARACRAGCAGRAGCARLEARCRSGARDAPKPLRGDASCFVRRDAGPRGRAPPIPVRRPSPRRRKTRRLRRTNISRKRSRLESASTSRVPRGGVRGI